MRQDNTVTSFVEYWIEISDSGGKSGPGSKDEPLFLKKGEMADLILSSDVICCLPKDSVLCENKEQFLISRELIEHFPDKYPLTVDVVKGLFSNFYIIKKIHEK